MTVTLDKAYYSLDFWLCILYTYIVARKHSSLKKVYEVHKKLR